MSYQEFRPGSFQSIPPVVKNILIINVVLFVAKIVFANKFSLDTYLDLHYYKSDLFKPYQFITYMFMHADITHIFFNMFGVYMFGSILERTWGAKRFLNYYLITGLGAAAAQYIMFYFEINSYVEKFAAQGLTNAPDYEDTMRMIYDSMVCLGASGALFGLLGAFAMMFPNTQLQIYFFIPMKAKYFVILYGAAELIYGVSNVQGDNVAHFAHLGGLVVGLIIMLIWRKNRNFFY